MAKLKNIQHECFCQEYIIDFNSARSARDSEFSKKTARTIGSKLLTRVDIQERIAELLRDRSERTKITQDMVLKELAILGFSDFADYAEIKKGIGLQVIPFEEIKEGKTRAIKSVKETTGNKSMSLSFKLHEKTRPLELIGKHLGMFADESILNVKGTIKVITGIPRPRKNNVHNNNKGNKKNNASASK